MARRHHPQHIDDARKLKRAIRVLIADPDLPGIAVGLGLSPVRLPYSGRSTRHPGVALLHRGSVADEARLRLAIREAGLPEELVDFDLLPAYQGQLPIQVRPVCPGVSMGHLQGPAGTLTAVVSRAGERLLLVSGHVVSLGEKARVGEAVVQPAMVDDQDGKADIIGTLVEIRAPHGPGPHTVDAALVRPGKVAIEPKQWGDQAERAPLADDPSELLDRMISLRARSGVRGGVVRRVNVDGVPVHFPGPGGGWKTVLDDAIEVFGTGSAFSLPGDSGALAWTDDSRVPGVTATRRVAVGMCTAGDGTKSLLLPIDAVLSALGVSLA